MRKIVEVNRIEDLAPYRQAWQSLLAQSGGASFFQSLEWLEQYWRHFGHGQKLRVFFLLDHDEPVGILPLAVIREPTKIGPIRSLTYPLQDFASVYGPIGPNPGATLTAALRQVRRTPRDWDAIDLRWTDTDGRDAGRTRRAMRGAGFQGIQAAWQQTAVIEVEGTWQQYLAGRPKKFRHKIRRQSRRFAELGNVEYRRYRPLGRDRGDADPRWDLYEQCVALARNSWQGASTTGVTLSHESVCGFFRETHRSAAAAGMLDVNLLLVDGRPVAFLYCYHFQGNVYAFKTGYDPRFAAVGLGNVLYAKTLEDSFQRGDRTINLGSGSMDIKRPWATRIVRTHRYLHYPLSVPRVQILRAKRLWENRPAGSGAVGRSARHGYRRGDRVEVRSEREIRATLDADGKCDGMPFMPEMVKFCGRRFSVHRRADRVFLDHHLYVGGMHGTVLLEGARCDGGSHGGCEMECLLLWKEDWLRPVESPAETDRTPGDTSSPNDIPLPTTDGKQFQCQATELVEATSPLPSWDLRQYVRDLSCREMPVRQFARMLWRMGSNRLEKLRGRDPYCTVTGRRKKTPGGSLDLKPGELVEVKSRDEIARTLDTAGRNRGLGFGPDLAAHCGSRFRVARRVNRVILEWSGKMQKLDGTVVLEGVKCDGAARRGCPRDCHHLWREIWLKRVEDSA